MLIKCIVVMFLKRIGKNNLTNARTLATTQNYCRAGENWPSNKTIINRYRNLQYNQHMVQATYIWIDGTGENIRIKDRILYEVPKCLADLPVWCYTENSPYQIIEGNSVEMMLYPRAIYRNPFKPGQHDIIVLCDTYKPDGSPFETNHRYSMQVTVNKTKDQEPIFDIEQEYTLLNGHGQPFGWPRGFTEDLSYCGVGSNQVHARDLVESHVLACLYAGIDFAGSNAEEFSSQWKYRIGPSVGIKAADDLWVSRYILIRIAEEYDICVTLHPKSEQGHFNETRAHITYSTAAMRADGGANAIKNAIERLEELTKIYNPMECDYISLINTFSWGTADRGVSIRVKNSAFEAGKKFLEDCRTPSNVDPYVVCNVILKTTALNERPKHNL